MSAPDTDIILCPDCGGVVGATEVTVQGAPCTCFADAPKARRTPAFPTTPADDMPSSGALGSISLSDEPGSAAGDEEDAIASRQKPDSSDTAQSEAIVPEAATQTEKRCVLCDKNVSGHRRLKDSRGYICLDCAKREQSEGKPKGVKCPKCFRVVKRESLGKFDGRLMCQRCLREAREVTKPGSKRFRKIDGKHFEEHSKTQLYVLGGVAVVLAIVILIGWLKS